MLTTFLFGMFLANAPDFKYTMEMDDHYIYKNGHIEWLGKFFWACSAKCMPKRMEIILINEY